MSEGHLFDLVFRTLAAFCVGLAVTPFLRNGTLARRWLWGICFAVPVAALVPLPAVTFDILPARAEPPPVHAAVFELANPPSEDLAQYGWDPPPSPWVVGVALASLIGLIGMAWRYVATLRLVRAAEQITDESLIDLAAELSQQAGLADIPLLLRSDAVDSPCAWGISQPAILVPAGKEYTQSEWRLILEHELLHLRRRDPARMLAYQFVRSALWFLPPIAWGLRDASLAHEQSVDAHFEGRSEYTDLLLRHAVPAAPALLARLRGQNHLLSRIRSAKTCRPERWTAAWPALAVVPFLAPIQAVAPYRPEAGRIGSDEFVFVRRLSSSHRLWRANIDGRGAHLMPDRFTRIGTPAVSPDGAWIAYSRDRDGQEDIYIARVDGTDERLLVGTRARDVQPRWSPDGTRIVYCTLETGNWEIGLAVVADGRTRLITQDGMRNLEPSWHPNGERLVFSSHRSGTQKLWSMNLDGTDLLQLTFGSRPDTHGRYSPDGRLLAFSSLRRNGNEAAILDLVTGRVQPLLRLAHTDSGEVEFTADGRAVLMTSWGGNESCIARVDLRDFRYSSITGEPSLWPAAR